MAETLLVYFAPSLIGLLFLSCEACSVLVLLFFFRRSILGTTGEGRGGEGESCQGRLFFSTFVRL